MSLRLFLMFVVVNTITQENNSENCCDSGKNYEKNDLQLLFK